MNIYLFTLLIALSSQSETKAYPQLFCSFRNTLLINQPYSEFCKILLSKEDSKSDFKPDEKNSEKFSNLIILENRENITIENTNHNEIKFKPKKFGFNTFKVKCIYESKQYEFESKSLCLHYFIIFPPMIIAILFSAYTRNGVAGTLIGSFIAITMANYFNPAKSFFLLFDTYIVGALANENTTKLILFISFLNAFMQLMIKNNFFAPIQVYLKENVRNQSAILNLAIVSSIFLFFDDYASILITGNLFSSMIRRKDFYKFALILQSISGNWNILVPMSSFTTVLIKALDGMKNESENSFALLLGSIKYQFFPIFMMAIVIITTLTNKLIGPLYKNSKSRSRDKKNSVTEYNIIDNDKKDEDIGKENNINNNIQTTGSIFLPIITIIVFIFSIILSFYISGYIKITEINKDDNKKIPLTISQCFMYVQFNDALIWVSVLYMFLFTIYLCCIGKSTFLCSYDIIIDSFKEILPTIMMLTTAQVFGESLNTLGTDVFVLNITNKIGHESSIFVLGIYIISSLLSLATGSSWVTLEIIANILKPILSSSKRNNKSKELHIVMGALISGAIFGNISLISDTTNLTIQVTKIDMVKHFSSQILYGLISALISVLSFISVTTFKINSYICITVGIIIQVLIVFIFGKRPNN